MKPANDTTAVDDRMVVQITVGELRQIVREECARQRSEEPTAAIKQWVDVAEAAEYFGRTPQTIRNWIKNGAPARQIGTASHPQFRIHLESFEQWMETLHSRRAAANEVKK